MAKGILIAAMDFSASREDEFHDWYDLEHIPERLRIPGFLNADRWIGSKDATVAGMEQINAAIPGAKLVKLEGAGHLSNLEQPAPFANAIRDFLN